MEVLRVFCLLSYATLVASQYQQLKALKMGDDVPLMIVNFNSHEDEDCWACSVSSTNLKRAAAQLGDISHRVTVGEVDCDAEETANLCQEYQIYKFPSIKLYRHGMFYRNFWGDVEKVDDIVEWIRKEEQKSIDEIGEPEKEMLRNYDERKWLEPQGFLALENATFDKIVGIGVYTVLVKVDVMMGNAWNENEWAVMCDALSQARDYPGNDRLLFATVGQWDRMDNDPLKIRWGLAGHEVAETLPVFLLFKKNVKSYNIEDAVRFDTNGALQARQVLPWLNDNLDEGRVVLPGTVPELDKVVFGFHELDQDEKNKRLGFVEKYVHDSDENTAEHLQAIFYTDVAKGLLSYSAEDSLNAIRDAIAQIDVQLMEQWELDLTRDQVWVLGQKRNIYWSFLGDASPDFPHPEGEEGEGYGEGEGEGEYPEEEEQRNEF